MNRSRLNDTSQHRRPGEPPRPGLHTSAVPEPSRAPGRDVDPRPRPVGGALEGFAGIVRRQLPIILLMIMLGVAGAGLYLFTMPPWFTASADVLTEAFLPVAGDQTGGADRDAGAAVETHVATIMSDRISRTVIKDLDLVEDPEFTRPASALTDRISALFGPPAGTRSAPEDDRWQAATEAFRQRLTAKRLGKTYIVRISFTSLFPDKAARIANQIAEAYISDQLESKFEVNQRTRAWLKERVADLSRQTQAAERAALDFKLANSLAADGQRIGEIERQLSEARGRMSAAQDRLNRITQIIEGGVDEEAFGEVLSSAAVKELRERYRDVTARANDWAGRYGEQHEAVQALRSEAKAALQSLAEEVRRIQQSIRAEYEDARSRWEAATRSLEQELGRSGEARHGLIRLRELEAAAHQSRMLYDEFVERDLQESQRPNFPTTRARVLTNAIPPATASHPDPAVVAALGLIAGLGAGLGLGLLREGLNRTIRTDGQLEAASGLPCLALLPKIKAGAVRARKSRGQGGPREVIPKRREWDAVLHSPFSPLDEGMRAIRLAADLRLAGEGCIVLGVTSALPEEGRSTVAANLAFHLARNGDRVLLVDCDMRRPALSAGLAGPSADGLREALDRPEADLGPLLWTHSGSGLHFLPAGRTADLAAHPQTPLGSSAMEELLMGARARYDYIVLDFAPLLPTVDARAAAHRVDGWIFVAAWNETPIGAVSDAVSLSSILRTRLLGTVLNKARMKKLRGYGGPVPSRAGSAAV
jgi:polysaccharide biosynthesis transport protein